MRGTRTPVDGESPQPNFLTAHKLTGEAKINGCMEFLETLLEAGCKFLLFAHHIPVMDAFSQFLTKKKTGFIRIDGSTPSDERHNLVAKFQHQECIRVAVLSIQACGFGLTLTAASTVVFAELSWTPAIMNQAEDRAHRIGQTNSVNIYYLYGSQTVDDVMINMIMQKSEVISDALDGKQTDYDIQRVEQKQCIEEVHNLKDKGKLNPIAKPKVVKPIQPFLQNPNFNDLLRINNLDDIKQSPPPIKTKSPLSIKIQPNLTEVK